VNKLQIESLEVNNIDFLTLASLIVDQMMFLTYLSSFPMNKLIKKWKKIKDSLQVIILKIHLFNIEALLVATFSSFFLFFFPLLLLLFMIIMICSYHHHHHHHHLLVYYTL
jgi:L-lactate permease